MIQKAGFLTQEDKVPREIDSLLEGRDLPPMIKRKKRGNNPRGTRSWCSASRTSVAPCSLCQGRFAPAPPMPPHYAAASLTAAARGALPGGRSGHPVIAGAGACSINASVVTNWSTTMKQQYVGLDVSLEQTS